MTTRPFAGATMGDFGRILLLAASLTTAVLTQARPTAPTTDATYDVLQIGARWYTNVTVTTKAKEYVFLMHSTGLMNVKVSDLPREVQIDLGYIKPESANSSPTKSFMSSLGIPTGKPADKTNEAPSAVAAPTTTAETVHKAVTDSPQFQFATTWLQNTQSRVPLTTELSRKNMREFCAAGAGLFLGYMFFCYCCAWIRRNAGKPDSGLVWVPFLQILPLLTAANMSELWAFALFLPPLGVAAAITFASSLGAWALPTVVLLFLTTVVFWFLVKIIWSFKIARACNKSPMVAIFLILPTTDFFAFLYLVFSNPNSERAQTNAARRKPRKEMMKLDPV